VVLNFDLGGWIADVDGLRAELENEGFEQRDAIESLIWRPAYALYVSGIIELDGGFVPLGFLGLEIPAAFRRIRIHPCGVLAIRYELAYPEHFGIRDASGVNDVIGVRRDVETSLLTNTPTDTHVGLPVTEGLLPTSVAVLRRLVAGRLVKRPCVLKRNSMNILHVLFRDPAREPRRVADDFETFRQLQGGVVDLEGGAPLSPLRWSHLEFVHFGGGSSLAVSSDAEAIEDFVSAYEWTHVNRFWLKTWLDVLDALDYNAVDRLRGRRLLERDLAPLAKEGLELADLRRRVTQQLVETDVRNIPLDSVFGRQALPALGRTFELEAWKALLRERLDTMRQQHEIVLGVVNFGYQAASRRQGEKLQLLFAGALAASLTAFIPALLTFANWGRPALPWVVTTIVATFAIWALVIVWVVFRWKISVNFDDGETHGRS
jgi:hypothetical protein